MIVLYITSTMLYLCSRIMRNIIIPRKNNKIYLRVNTISKSTNIISTRFTKQYTFLFNYLFIYLFFVNKAHICVLIYY